jgi:hypothetical protein
MNIMRALKLTVFLIHTFSLTMLFILSGCSDTWPEGSYKTLTSTVQVSRAISATPSKKAVEKPTATLNEQKITPTILLTPASTRAPNPSVLPTQTWTPIPTFDPQEKQWLIGSYFTDARDCEIPCWWKIIPGQTTWQEARQILSPLDTEKGPYTNTRLLKYFYTFQQATELSPLGFELVVWIDDDRVIAVQTNSQWIKTDLDASLAGLLKTFGQPGQIWVQVDADSPGSETAYQLELFYQDQGVLIRVNGKALLTEKSVILCPQKKGKNDFPPSILLFSSPDYDNYEKLTSDLYGNRTSGISTFIFRRLSTLTNGFGEDEFFTSFLDKQSDACIEISIEKLNR